MRVVLLLGSLLLASAVNAAETVDEKLLKLFEARTYREASGSSIPYRLSKPEKYDAKEKYPLVLFLHGAVGAGDNNRLQFNGGNEVPAKALTSPRNREKFPCFILAPQCPRNDKWGRGPFEPTGHATDSMRLTLGALASVRKEFSIDADRLYIIGLSMGGHGVWDLISRQPGMFAAAVPICSAGDTSKARLLVRLPIWCFHGDADPYVDVKYAREMIAALRKAGGHPKYTEYPGVGHNSYVNAFQEPQLLPWLFEQKRSAPQNTTTPTESVR